MPKERSSAGKVHHSGLFMYPLKLLSIVLLFQSSSKSLNIFRLGVLPHRPVKIVQISRERYMILSAAGELYLADVHGDIAITPSAKMVSDAVSLEPSSAILAVDNTLSLLSIDGTHRRVTKLLKAPNHSSFVGLHYNASHHLLFYVENSCLTWYRVREVPKSAINLNKLGQIGLQGYIFSVCVSEQGTPRVVVSRSLDGISNELSQFRFSANKLQFEGDIPFEGSFRDLRLSPNGSYLCLATDRQVVRYDSEMRANVIRLNHLGFKPLTEIDNGGDIIAWPRDEGYLAVVHSDNRVLQISTQGILDGSAAMRIIKPGLAIISDVPGTVYKLTWK